jgi:1-phosphofructokinase family hexose kinase
MIVTLTPNPAVDQTIWVERLNPSTTARYQRWELDPAGKGVNVSRMVHRLGWPTMAFGFLAGETGVLVQRALEEEGVRHHFVHVSGLTRIDVVIVDAVTGDETAFYGPGPRVGREHLLALQEWLDRWLQPGRVLVLAGSLPPGLPQDTYAGLIRLAHARGVRTILNTSGEALRLGLRARPYLVKARVGEAEELLGRPLPDAPAVVGATREMVGRGVQIAAITMGARGAICVQGERVWWAAPPPVAGRDKVGAGDSLVAGLAVALARGEDTVSGLRLGTAAAAATVMAPGTGLGAAGEVAALLPRVQVEDVTEVALPSAPEPAAPAPPGLPPEAVDGGLWRRLTRRVGRYVAPRAVELPKRPVGPRERLRYGMDIDGTITQAPRHFKRLIDALLAAGDHVSILTARLESTRAETEALLASLGIQYDELLMRPDDWPRTIADYKVQMVRDRELHLLMDDDPRNCWAVIQRSEALAGHMLPIPETPEAGLPAVEPERALLRPLSPRTWERVRGEGPLA